MPIPLSQLTTGSGTATLTSDERDYIREVLGISPKSSDSKHRASEARFDVLTGYQNQSARYWIAAYDAVGDSTILIDAEGASISKARQRERYALALYNLVFADGTVTPLDNIDVTKYDETRPRISFVPMTFEDTSDNTSEY